MLGFSFTRRTTSQARPKTSVLLIDADRDTHTVVNVVFDLAGMSELLSAHTGLEGLQAARRQKPDVILLEMRLPDSSGENVLRSLTADPLTQGIPVILFTAFPCDLDRVDYLPYADIVLKPFCMQKLCSTIRSVAASRRPQAHSLPFLPGNRRAVHLPSPPYLGAGSFPSDHITERVGEFAM